MRAFSIGSFSEVKSLELQQTIRLIQLMEEQIAQIEARINPIVDSLVKTGQPYVKQA